VLLKLFRTDGFQEQPVAAATAVPTPEAVAPAEEVPEFQDTMESTNALRASDRGRRMLAAGQVKAAVSLLADASRTLPDNAELAHTYGEALWRFAARDRAVFQFRRALKLSPDNPTYREDLGRALYAIGRTAEAAHLLRGPAPLVAEGLAAPTGSDVTIPPALPAEDGVNLGGAGAGTFKGRRSFNDQDLSRGRVVAPAPAPSPTEDPQR
jgi:hypothetical protein